MPNRNRPAARAQLQHFDEQRLHVGGVPPAKPGDHRVIRHLVTDDEPEPGIAPAGFSIFRLDRSLLL